jgi:uncharacterized protein YbjT (DUF2867 family)
VQKILLAGSTGYLGLHIARQLQKKGYYFKAIARNPEKVRQNDISANEVIAAEVTQPKSIRDCCKDIDVAISTVGITRQKDGHTYMDVDYQANLNLLKEAKKSCVKKFIYVAALNGEKLKHLKICAAKELFAEELKDSGLDYCIIRPNGFFSDMSEFFHMAKKGKVYLFGDGELKINPIHGEDLAAVCVDAIDSSEKEIEIGGPETLTQNEIATLAFDILGEKPKIAYIPHWVRVAILKLVRLFTGSKTYGPIEFFMNAMAMDMIAPKYGKDTLKEHFRSLLDAEA